MDLSTRYLGLDLRTPIVAAASPLNGDPSTARLVEDSGASAIVMPSLFEEELVDAELQRAGDRYLAKIEALKQESSVPVIASLNANSAGGWVQHATLIEQAGADALELNLYHVAADPDLDAIGRETADLEIVRSVRDALSIPLSVKLSPYYTTMAHFAAGVVGAGADGLVLFNRFYQPDLDLDSLEVVNRVELSRPGDLRLPLRWIAILRPQLGPEVSIAASSGVDAGTDVVKALMVGADVAMLTSAVLRYGPRHLRTVEAELVEWMTDHGHGSVDQLRGRATQQTSGDPSAFERANYVQTLHSWTAPLDPTGTPPLS